MRLPPLLIALCATLACAPSTPTVATPAAAPKPRSASVPAPAPTYDSVPGDWQFLDAELDGVQGTSLRRAERELLAGRTPARTVIVAVIDGGVDTAHAALRSRLWINPREAMPNGRDDDGDGLVGDRHGWDYLGGPDGRVVGKERLELTRQYARCSQSGSAAATAPSMTMDCATIKTRFDSVRASAVKEAGEIQNVHAVYGQIVLMLTPAMGGRAITAENVRALASVNDTVIRARELYLKLDSIGIDGATLEEAVRESETRLAYNLNPDFDPRGIVGDDPSDVTQRVYGNADVMGPEAGHGTHVAGIIATAARGAEGAEADVKLLVVRAVPQGDEYDKDVANAIRYAVDHGAQIINMSFGKDLSPEKRAVDDAVRHAVSHGVLLVHAAGNDGANLATSGSYPSRVYLDGGTASTWIEVGASSWKGGGQLAASFSNYGAKEVDLFSPGVDILSTVPGGGYGRKNGTSMAAPLVSGIAAVLMSYFPDLTAADVKRILLDTATPFGDVMVAPPGAASGTVRFGDLSATGGVVNAHAAIKAALALERAR